MEFFKKEKAVAVAKQLLQREGVQPLESQADHKHEWDLVSKTYVPQRRDLQPVSIPQDTIEKMLFGATIYLWECVICRSLRKETMLGHDVSQLDEMIDKIDQYGSQYIQRADGQTYIIAKWQQQPAQHNNVLPLR